MSAIEGLSDCPTWCAGGVKEHRQALDEGCTVEGIKHRTDDLCTRLDRLTNAYQPRQVLRDCPAMVTVQLVQPGQPTPFGSYPLIEVEISVFQGEGENLHHRSTNLELTTGEARTLAAQLVYLADLEDLHHNV